MTKVPLSIKCIVDGCNKSAVDLHAVCSLHLFMELTVLAAAGLCLLAAITVAVLGTLRY